MKLVVSEAVEISNRGTVVFFETEPSRLLAMAPHAVRVTKPNGEEFDIKAHVEYARKVPPGEVMALLFPTLSASKIPKGCSVDILGRKTDCNENGT